MTKKVFKIANMHCSACVMLLEGLEDELPGVKSIKASYQKGQMEVEFDEVVLNEDKIKERVEKKGYQIV